MANIVVIGAQWGDEGKGKITDYLSLDADLVVRFQGGHNAGHTLVVKDKVYKLSLLPSGIIRDDVVSIIGNGVVIDPWALLDEINRLCEQGIVVTPDKLMIAENAALILPIHQAIDRISESRRTKSQQIGTTRRGIGPAYEDKVARRAVRICDLADPDHLSRQIHALIAHYSHLLPEDADVNASEWQPFDPACICDQLQAIAGQILAFAGPVWRKLADCHAQGKHILFEGAQGAMLDVDFGTYPFVTSSNTGAGQAASGTGFAPAKIDYVLGVAKAYSTRVGHGPFPSELKDEIGDYLVECGKEFGTVTGRKRRCGWFDAPLVHQMVQIHGLGGIALTRLDVLDGLERLAICTGYEIDGIFVQDLPALSSLAFRARPVLEYHPGWQKPTSSIRDYDALPEQARGYIERIESLIKAPVALCSVGPERDATIMRQHPFGR